MNQAAIRSLLERFYEGATSEEEEQQLQQYFTQDHVDEDLMEEKAYFEAMYSIKETKLDESFEQVLMSKLVDDKPKKSFRTVWYSLSGVAATIAIFLSIWFGTDLLKPKEVYGTINDPVIAFAETKKALDEVSQKMNQGLKPANTTVKKVEKNVQKAGEVKKIDKALKKTKSIKKLNETLDIVSSVYIGFGG